MWVFLFVPQKHIRAMSWTRSSRRSRCRRYGVTWPKVAGIGEVLARRHMKVVFFGRLRPQMLALCSYQTHSTC